MMQSEVFALDARAAYDRYVRTISTPDMAISWESASLAAVLALVMRPRVILDWGSGFTSWMMRRTCPTATIYSIDDHAEWLDKTRAFCAEDGLGDIGVFCTREAVPPDVKADLLLYDYGYWDARLATLPEALTTVAAGGIVLADDQHYGPLYAACQALGWDNVAIPEVTLDVYQRWAAVLRAPTTWGGVTCV